MTHSTPFNGITLHQWISELNIHQSRYLISTPIDTPLKEVLLGLIEVWEEYRVNLQGGSIAAIPSLPNTAVVTPSNKGRMKL